MAVGQARVAEAAGWPEVAVAVGWTEVIEDAGWTDVVAAAGWAEVGVLSLWGVLESLEKAPVPIREQGCLESDLVVFTTRRNKHLPA